MLQTILTFPELPCSHRRFRHIGSAKWLHGYSRSYTIVIEGAPVAGEVFSADFTELQELGDFIGRHFDHTVLLDEGDPAISDVLALAVKYDLCRVVVLPSASLEGCAEWLFHNLSRILLRITDGRAKIVSVEVRESSEAAGRYVAAGRP